MNKKIQKLLKISESFVIYKHKYNSYGNIRYR